MKRQQWKSSQSKSWNFEVSREIQRSTEKQSWSIRDKLFQWLTNLVNITEQVMIMRNEGCVRLNI